MRLSAQSINIAIEQIHNTYTQSLDALAEKARQEIVIPFCDKHGIDFVVGMGICFFEGSNTDCADWDEWLRTHERPPGRRCPVPKGYEDVRNVVQLSIPDTTGWQGADGTLGLLMKSYKPGKKDG